MECDVVMVTDFLPEVFISDGVVVFAVGASGVVRGFVVVVVFSSTEGSVVSVVDGSFSSVDSAAEDVTAFMVMG